MKHIILILVILMWGNTGLSQQNTAVKFTGFGMWVQEMPHGENSTLKLKHAWVIVDKEIDSNFSVKGMFAFTGPPKVVHSLFGRWNKPLVGIDYIRLGRFEPPFGHGINYYRVDRNPTIFYSAIDSPVVARSNGVEIGGKFKNFHWNLGAFSGERLFGNVPLGDENSWDVYSRLRYHIDSSLIIGISQRFGSVYAWSAEFGVTWQPVNVELEAVGSQDTVRFSALIVGKQSKIINLVLRCELLPNETRLTPGIIIFLPNDWEVKGNVIYNTGLGKINIDKTLIQVVIRW